jgi:hypothetical protein
LADIESEAYLVGVVEGSVTALPESTVLANVECWKDFRRAESCSTWGQFRTHCSAFLIEQAEERCIENEEPVPADDEPFELGTNIPGIYEFYPPWLAAVMLDRLPEEVRRVAGTGGTSMLSGDYYTIEESELERVTAALDSLGIPWRRDDALMLAAVGYDSL